MRDVKRQTRTLKCSLEGHVGTKDHQVTSHLEVDANGAIRCDQFLWDWQRWPDCDRHSGCAWRKLVAEFWRVCLLPPSIGKSSVMQPKLYVGRYLALAAC